MKKTVFSGILLFITACFTLSCNLNIKTDSRLNRPDLKESESGVIISAKYVNSKTEYINIFRLDVTGSDPDEADAQNIGIIFPAAFDKANQTYSFEDLNAVVGRKYAYAARLYAEGEYYLTNWTDKKDGFEIKTGHGTAVADYNNPLDSELGFDVSGITFEYDADNNTITASSSPSAPTKIKNADSYETCLLVKKTDRVQLFPVKFNASISLTNILPTDFFDCDIYILGIIGQNMKKTSGTDPIIQECIFTQPSLISLSSGGNPVTDNKIKIITSTAGNGLDYTPYKQ